MNTHIGLGIFGTFGEPYGFQQTFYYGAQYRSSLDLDENEIEFYPGADLYAVRREVIDGVHSICISIYSYAQELNTARLGTFLGSCMVLQDGFTEAEYAAKVLQSLHDDLMTNEDNVLDNIIRAEKVTDIIIREPAEFVAVQANVIPLNKTPFYSAWVDTAKKILVIPSAKSFGNKETEVFEFLDEALKHYSDTGTLYFSFDRNVYDFVRSTGKIEIMEWDEYVGRKEAMLRSTAVRTKKGIQKSVPQPTDYIPVPGNNSEATVKAGPEETEDNIIPIAAGLTQDREWRDDDVLPSADPYKPFGRWQQPEEPWNEDEVKERVTEYNRLFNYTNTLIDHINEENQAVVRQNRKRQLLVAALLLLLTSGSVAVYFMGLYKPVTNTKIVAAMPETPRTVSNRQVVVNNDTFIAAPSQSAANGTTPGIAGAGSPTDSTANAPVIVAVTVKDDKQKNTTPSYSYVAPVAYDDDDDATTTTAMPVATRVATPVATPSTIQTAPTPAVSNTVVPDAGGGTMPRISLPGSTHTNLPAAAVYTSKVQPEPVAAHAPSVATVSNIAGTTLPATKRSGVVLPALPQPSGSTNNHQGIATTEKVMITVDKKTTLVAVMSSAPTQPMATVVVPTVNAIGVPAATRSVTPAPPARSLAEVGKPITSATTGTAGTSNAANITAKPASAAVATTMPVAPAMVVAPAKTANVSFNPLPAAVHSFAATAKAQHATTVAIPATLAAETISKTTPAMPLRDTGKQRATANKSTPSVDRQQPVRSGVSDGEMNRANAVIMPQMAVASRPASPEMKMKTLSPRPNGYITQRDVPLLYQSGIKDKTLSELTRIILENAPEMVGAYYKGQEMQYAAALLNGNRQAFERRGDDYVCTGDYLILHIPAVLKPRKPVANPK